MNKITKTSLALVALGLLSTSALASSGTQDTSFLKKDKEMPAAAPAEAPMMNKYLVLEAAYNFNQYEPKFDYASKTTSSTEDSGSFTVGLGRMVNKNVLVDGTFSYMTPTEYKFTSGNDTYKSKVTTFKLMLNGTYLIDTPKENISPYITAGIGGAFNNYDTDTYQPSQNHTRSVDGTDTQFAYQAGLGISYKLQNESRINLGYLFSDNGQAYKVDTVKTERLQNHSVVLGFKMPF